VQPELRTTTFYNWRGPWALTQISVTLNLYILLTIQLSAFLTGVRLKAAHLEEERKAANEKTTKSSKT
jgi:hypothetical protein